jgi:hypothetical protein
VKSLIGVAGALRIWLSDGISLAKKAPELVGRKYIESLAA